MPDFTLTNTIKQEADESVFISYSSPCEAPFNLSDLEFWIDPSVETTISYSGVQYISPIDLIYDKTPNSINFIPIVGGDNIYYDRNRKMTYHSGNNDRTVFSSTLSNYFNNNTNDWTYFIVVEENLNQTAPPNLRILSQIACNDPGNGQRCVLSSSLFDSYEILNFSPSSLISHPGKQNYILGKRSIITVVRENGRLSLYYNGLYCGFDNINLPNTTNFLIGGSTNTNIADGNFSGWVGEHILFRSALDLKNIIKCVNYLNQKWNVFDNRVCDYFLICGAENARGVASNQLVNPLYPNQGNGCDYGFYVDPQFFYNTHESPISCLISVGTGGVNFATGPGVPTVKQLCPELNGNLSMWVAFAEEYYKQTGRLAVFTYLCYFGSSLFNDTEWDPDNFQNNYIQSAINLLPLSTKKLENNGFKVYKSNIIFLQGESDTLVNQNVYYEKFNSLTNILVNNGFDNFFYYINASVGSSRNAQLLFANNTDFDNNLKTNIHCLFDTFLFSNNLGRLNLMQAGGVYFNNIALQSIGTEGAKEISNIIEENRSFTFRKSKTLYSTFSQYEKTNVKYWGALGNGFHDDTTEIQLAIDNNTDFLYFPEGIYYISGQLDIFNKNNLNINFQNCIILTSATSNFVLNFDSNTGLRTFGSLRIECPGVQNVLIACHFENCRNCLIEDIYVDGQSLTNQFFSGFDVIRYNTNRPADYYIYNLIFKNCHTSFCSYGAIVREINVSFDSCRFQYCNTECVRINVTSQNTILKNCHLINSELGVRIDGQSSTDQMNVTLDNCFINYNVVCGVFLQSARGVNISSCNISSHNGSQIIAGFTPLNFTFARSANGNASNLQYGIYSEGSEDISIDGCIFNDNRISLAYDCCRCYTITNNTFQSNSTLTLGHIREIDINMNASYINSRDISICNNSFSGLYSGSSLSLTQKYIQFFYGNSFNTPSLRYKVLNNVSNNSGESNIKYSGVALASGTAVILDRQYETINIVLGTSTANYPLTIGPSFFGYDFEINVYSETNRADVSLSSNVKMIFTTNWPSSPSAAFEIFCNGIEIDNTGITLTEPGKYVFNSSATPGYNYLFSVTKYENSLTQYRMETNTTRSTSLSMERYLYINLNSAYTLTFTDIGSTFIDSFYFYFVAYGGNSDIIMSNGSGINIIYITKTQFINISNGSTYTITGNNRNHMHFCHFLRNATARWMITQL